MGRGETGWGEAEGRVDVWEKGQGGETRERVEGRMGRVEWEGGE